MECGKIKSPGSPIFYFVLDPVTPDEPHHTRLRRYYVVSHIDSYVEAFYFIARHFATPSATLDASIARWHALYTRVFGTVALENFRKSLMSVPVEHFFLATSEESAKSKAVLAVNASSMHVPGSIGGPSTSPRRNSDAAQGTLSDATGRRWENISAISTARPNGVSNGALIGESEEARRLFDGHTQRHHQNRAVSFANVSDSHLNASRIGGSVLTTETPLPEDARVELHRLKAELADASRLIDLERSRSKVNALSDAERAALIYQLEGSRKEVAEERMKAKDASDRLREVAKSLETRLAELTTKHEDTLRQRAASEFERMSEMESRFMEREKKVQTEYEQAIHDRDHKLSKALSRVKSFEIHLEDALRRVEEQKVKIQELHTKLAESLNNTTSLEEENRRLKRHLHDMEMQLDAATRVASRSEDDQRKAEAEAAGLRIEVARLRREMDRYSHFSQTLHRELQQLDDSAITAAELLRRRVMAMRDSGEAAP